MHLLTIVRDSVIFLEPGVDSSEQPDIVSSTVPIPDRPVKLSLIAFPD
jgi:hypothetical protein